MADVFVSCLAVSSLIAPFFAQSGLRCDAPHSVGRVQHVLVRICRGIGDRTEWIHQSIIRTS